MSTSQLDTFDDIDWQTARENFVGPGTDTRQWFTYGIVEPETADQKSVEFDPDYGPLVNVVLQPSAIAVRCRVASWIAGNLEGSYYPFMGGDEVLVAVPEGDERAGCVIIGRMNQQIDAFPTMVGGADVTNNTVAFQRMRVPFILETAAGYLIHSATHGSFINLEAGGNVTVGDGGKSFMHVGVDFVGFQYSDNDGNARALLQLMDDSGTTVFSIEVDSAAKFTMTQDDTGYDVPGTFHVAASGMAATEHAISAEAVAGLLVAVGALVAPPITPAQVAGAIATAAAAPLDPLVFGAIQTALAAKIQNIDGTTPNVGCPGFLLG